MNSLLCCYFALCRRASQLLTSNFNWHFFVLAAIVKICNKTFSFSHFFFLPFPHLTTTRGFGALGEARTFHFNSFARLALYNFISSSRALLLCEGFSLSFHFAKFTIITVDEIFACFFIARCFWIAYFVVFIISRLSYRDSNWKFSHDCRNLLCFTSVSAICTHLFFSAVFLI